MRLLHLTPTPPSTPLTTSRPYDSRIAAGLGQGLLWAFTDCLAKKGPALITADKTLIGCDPVSGRAQEVNLCWEQLCVADRYDIEIAKDADFTIRVIDWATERRSGCGWSYPGSTSPSHASSSRLAALP